MNTKITKTYLNNMIRSYVKGKKEWFNDVMNMRLSDESLMLFFRRESDNILDDLITIANIIQKRLK